MNRRRLGSRFVALLCAYAFVLQAFLSAAILTAHAARVPTSLVCSSQSDGTSPAAPAPTSCDLHCLVPGLGCGGTLPSADVAAVVAPAAVVLAPRPFAVLSRAPH
ncbi:MAG TPA: hypothetical protein VNK48_12900, partial [Xanthobacteraceae bacterium]|nr:hypothetical protein [Xanthobacteraceae bacterium]